MLCQKNFNDTPKAIDGTIMGTLIKESRMADGYLPKIFREIKIAMGIPRIIPRTVTMAANPYDSERLCQKLAQIPDPVKA